METSLALSWRCGQHTVGAQSRERSTGPEKVGEGSTEEGTLELDLDKRIDCKEEILCVKVKKRHEVVWNSLGALRSVCESSEGVLERMGSGR